MHRSGEVAARLARLLAAAALALMTCACGGGGDDGDPPAPADDPGNPYVPTPPPTSRASCTFIAGGGSAIDVSLAACAHCSVSPLAAAIDGDPATFATVRYPPGVGGIVAVRATAQPGIVYPALGSAGALLSTGGTRDTVIYRELNFRAYLQGVPTGSDFSFSPTVVGSGGHSEPQRYGFGTTGPFDAVELELDIAASLGEYTLNIHEFCSGH